MLIFTAIGLGMLAFAFFVAWRCSRGRLKRLEYICMTNSKALEFYYCNTHGEMRIEVTPRSGKKKWNGSVSRVYDAFASPTGWESRDAITTTRTVDEEYHPGQWREELPADIAGSTSREAVDQA